MNKTNIDQIGIGIMSSLIIFPPSFLLIQLFRRSKSSKTRTVILKGHIQNVAQPTPQEIQDEFAPELDKTLVPPDDLTPPLLTDQNLQNHVKLTHPTEDLQDINQIDDSTPLDEVIKDLAELDKEAPLDQETTVGPEVEESDSENEQENLDVPNLTSGLHLRSGKNVRFQ